MGDFTEASDRNSSIVFRCNLCGYLRWLVDDPMLQAECIPHPIYGKVSRRQLANLDKKYHDCSAHIAATERVRNAIPRSIRRNRSVAA